MISAANFMAQGTLTDDIWWAAQSPLVQTLRHMPQGTHKNQLLAELFNQGALLDGPVVALGYSPSWQMQYLQEGKYEWFPAMGYPQLAGAPGIVPQGPMPPWGIKVSTDANDYPKWGE
jgi:hypothetical protein